MLLRELEPGMLFRFTDAAIKAQREYLLGLGRSPYTLDKVAAGPFELLTPQRTVVTDLGESPVTAEFWGPGSTSFHPSVTMDYEVEVVPQRLGAGSILPARSWLTTSADPEVFLEYKGKIVPGFAVLPPKKAPGLSLAGGGRYHEDGFQAEFSPCATACHETVAYSIWQTMTDMVNFASKDIPYVEGSIYEGVRVSDATFVELTPELLATGTDDQVALGCDSSENVWGHPAFSPNNSREFPFRMAGGHIHLGKTHEAKWFHSRAERIIRAMDVFLGVPSVALLAGIEDPRRRQFYGRAGEFRFQKHGLEYRSLSNAWLQHPALTHLVLNLARGAFRLGTMDWEKDFKYDPGLVRHIINEHDVKAAKAFVEENAKLLIWIMDKDSGYGWGAKGLSTIHAGAKETFGAALGIHKNWVHTGEPQRYYQYIAQHNVVDWPVVREVDIKVPAPPRTAVPRLRPISDALSDALDVPPRFTRIPDAWEERQVPAPPPIQVGDPQTRNRVEQLIRERVPGAEQQQLALDQLNAVYSSFQSEGFNPISTLPEPVAERPRWSLDEGTSFPATNEPQMPVMPYYDGPRRVRVQDNVWVDEDTGVAL